MKIPLTSGSFSFGASEDSAGCSSTAGGVIAWSMSSVVLGCSEAFNDQLLTLVSCFFKMLLVSLSLYHLQPEPKPVSETLISGLPKPLFPTWRTALSHMLQILAQGQIQPAE